MVEVLKLPVQAVEALLRVNVQQPPRRKQDRRGNPDPRLIFGFR